MSQSKKGSRDSSIRNQKNRIKQNKDLLIQLTGKAANVEVNDTLFKNIEGGDQKYKKWICSRRITNKNLRLRNGDPILKYRRLHYYKILCYFSLPEQLREK